MSDEKAEVSEAEVTPLTEAEYEPIRHALFDCHPGQSATEAKKKIAENLAAAGFRIVKDDPEHYVCFTEDSWFIEHSLKCRVDGTIGTCQFNRAIRDIADDMPGPEDLGRWRITGIDSEGVPSLERVS